MRHALRELRQHIDCTLTEEQWDKLVRQRRIGGVNVTGGP
jgi:hypothetical protein